MKLPVSNTNAPVWRDITVKSQLPAALKSLEKLSRNLWWVWNSEAKNLFRDLDQDIWRATGENPVMLIQQLPSERLDEIMSDKEMMARIDHVWKMFQDYMAQPMRNDIPSVSYFSMEYGLCRRPWCPCRRLHKRSIRLSCQHDCHRIPLPLRLFHTDTQCRRSADCQL